MLRATQRRIARRPISNLYENIEVMPLDDDIGQQQHRAGPAQRKSRLFVKRGTHSEMPEASVSYHSNQRAGTDMEVIEKSGVAEEQIYVNL